MDKPHMWYRDGYPSIIVSLGSKKKKREKEGVKGKETESPIAYKRLEISSASSALKSGKGTDIMRVQKPAPAKTCAMEESTQRSYGTEQGNGMPGTLAPKANPQPTGNLVRVKKERGPKANAHPVPLKERTH